jgi:hypothetical protein
MDWQFYWRKWHLGTNIYTDEPTGLKTRYLFIGPLQIKWYIGKCGNA